MKNGSGDASALFGAPDEVEVDRALTEIRAGRPIRIVDAAQSITVLPVEGLTRARLDAFRALGAPAPISLIVSATRAAALGLSGEATVLPISPRATTQDIIALVSDRDAAAQAPAQAAGADGIATIELMKLAEGLPAALAIPSRDHAHGDIPFVHASAVARYRHALIQSLTIAGEARVPLANAPSTRFVTFRDATGSTSVAVVIGAPDTATAVPVRIHSACLTGDVFGSRRCDCGDQLQLAITRIADAGGGVVLYLAQEGRGLGLINKMRAYELQDDGLDTIDANTTLGFEDDERDYGIAARMLDMLGITHVELLTNNPAKLAGLADAGIHVACRMPIEAPVNSDNRRYLTAKAERAGHKLDHLLSALHATQRSREAVP